MSLTVSHSQNLICKLLAKEGILEAVVGLWSMAQDLMMIRETDRAMVVRVRLEEERTNRDTKWIGTRGPELGVFKEPNGAPPVTITREFTSTQAKNWAEEMKMYGARCQNLESLANHFQQLLINKLLEDSLAREVELKIGDIFYTAIRRVSNIFKIIHPTFLRKVRFISQKPELGERTADTLIRMDELAERAKLDNISAPGLKLMKFCSMTTEGELRQKICKLQG